MNQEQTDKLRVLEWVFDHKYPATLKDKIEAAKEIYSFVYGEEIHSFTYGKEQAAPDETIVCKESDIVYDYGDPEKDKLLPIAKIFLRLDALLDTVNEKTYALDRYTCSNCGKCFYIDAGENFKDYYCPSCGK